MTPNRLIFGRDEAVAAWVARQMPRPVNFGPCRAVAIASGNRPIGGVVYSSYDATAGTVQMSIATISPLWAQRQTIRDLLAIPFDGYGCFKVWAVTSVDNLRSQKFLRHIGFKPEATLRHQMGRGLHGRFFSMIATEFAAKWPKMEAA